MLPVERTEAEVSLYLEEIAQYPPLTREEELELNRRIMAGEDCSRRLVEGNLRLVVDMARESARCDVSLVELIEEGNAALIRAAERYRPYPESRFINYASKFIRQAIVRAIAEAPREHRIPVRTVEQINRLLLTFEQLKESLGREPTSEELAAHLELPVEEIRELLGITESTQIH